MGYSVELLGAKRVGDGVMLKDFEVIDSQYSVHALGDDGKPPWVDKAVALRWLEGFAREAFIIADHVGVQMFAIVEDRPALVQLQSSLTVDGLFKVWCERGKKNSMVVYVTTTANVATQVVSIAVKATPEQVYAAALPVAQPVALVLQMQVSLVLCACAIWVSPRRECGECVSCA